MPYKNDEEKKKYFKDYNLRNKEKLKKQAHERYLKNKPHVAKQSKEWLATHPEYRLWKQARDSSKQRSLECTITQEDIIIPEYCTYLGIKLTDNRDSGRHDSNISLDRINNTKGYVPGNVQVISSKANFMKRNATIEELIQFAEGILNTHIKTSP